MAAQQLENFVFERRQAHRFAVHGHALALGVQHQPADGDLLFRHLHRAELRIAPQLAFHARDQLRRVERLGDVVIRPRCQAEYLICVLAFRREQDDRQVFALPHLQQGLDAVQLGHHDVQYDQMHLLRHHDVERLQPVVRLAHRIAVRLQKDRDTVHDLAIVVHDQHSQLFHLSSPFPCFYLTTGFCCFPQGNS